MRLIFIFVLMSFSVACVSTQPNKLRHPSAEMSGSDSAESINAFLEKIEGGWTSLDGGSTLTFEKIPEGWFLGSEVCSKESNGACGQGRLYYVRRGDKFSPCSTTECSSSDAGSVAVNGNTLKSTLFVGASINAEYTVKANKLSARFKTITEDGNVISDQSVILKKMTSNEHDH